MRSWLAWCDSYGHDLHALAKGVGPCYISISVNHSIRLLDGTRHREDFDQVNLVVVDREVWSWGDEGLNFFRTLFFFLIMIWNNENEPINCIPPNKKKWMCEGVDMFMALTGSWRSNDGLEKWRSRLNDGLVRGLQSCKSSSSRWCWKWYHAQDSSFGWLLRSVGVTWKALNSAGKWLKSKLGLH